MVMTTNASIRACYGCPWCEDDGDPDCDFCGFCEGELDDHTGVFPICTSGFCQYCFGYFVDDPGQTFIEDNQCPVSPWGAQVQACSGPLPAPRSHTQDVDLESIFTAYSVTYSAGAMGSNLETKNGEDLCAVWGYASVRRLIIVYVYETTGVNVGGCRKYCFDTNEGLNSPLIASAGDHINRVNAQTTGRSIYDLGITATGSSTPFMYKVYDSPYSGDWIRLDTGGTVNVPTYQPPKVYFTFDGDMCTDPFSCGYSNEGLTWSMISDTKQRTDTSVSWNAAYCPYNYTWSVTDLGRNVQTLECVFSSA
tara:strand:+ start:8602 stop:9525 length:924 start_codon:yes stop_codon:yes gene_type:complete